MSGRPKTPLVLGATEREQLIALTKRRKTAQALALRARIVLACAEGLDNKVVAARLRVTQQTVSKWRGRFVELRMQGLLDAPRPGAPRTIEDERVDAVIAKTLESVPVGATHWSTRTMAHAMGMSQTAVSRIWRAFGLQQHPHAPGPAALLPCGLGRLAGNLAAGTAPSGQVHGDVAPGADLLRGFDDTNREHVGPDNRTGKGAARSPAGSGHGPGRTR